MIYHLQAWFLIFRAKISHANSRFWRSRLLRNLTSPTARFCHGTGMVSKEFRIHFLPYVQAWLWLIPTCFALLSWWNLCIACCVECLGNECYPWSAGEKPMADRCVSYGVLPYAEAERLYNVVNERKKKGKVLGSASPPPSKKVKKEPRDV